MNPVRVSVAAAIALAAVPADASQTAPALLPPRLLHCEVARMTNLDARREQTMDEIVLAGRYRFDLMLPAIPVRTTPPPQETDPAEPVDPATQISADQDGLFARLPKSFVRVVDLWPERVELVGIIAPPDLNMIVLDQIDVEHGVADIFMTRARDAVSYDLTQAYRGRCKYRLE